MKSVFSVSLRTSSVDGFVSTGARLFTSFFLNLIFPFPFLTPLSPSVFIRVRVPRES